MLKNKKKPGRKTSHFSYFWLKNAYYDLAKTSCRTTILLTGSHAAESRAEMEEFQGTVLNQDPSAQ